MTGASAGKRSILCWKCGWDLSANWLNPSQTKILTGSKKSKLIPQLCNASACCKASFCRNTTSWMTGFYENGINVRTTNSSKSTINNWQKMHIIYIYTRERSHIPYPRPALLSRWFSLSPGGICDRFLEGNLTQKLRLATQATGNDNKHASQGVVGFQQFPTGKKEIFVVCCCCCCWWCWWCFCCCWWCCLFVGLFVCLFACLFGCLFVCLFVWLVVCLFVCLFGCLFVCLFVCLLLFCIFGVEFSKLRWNKWRPFDC